MWLFYCFNFETNYDVLMSKNPCFFLNKKVDYDKNETESKMEIMTQRFREALCFSSYKNSKLKIKL